MKKMYIKIITFVRIHNKYMEKNTNTKTKK